MALTKTLKTQKLTPTVGAEVLDLDRDRLAKDDDLPRALMEALEANGVLLIRELNIDDETQAEFCRKLGEVRLWPGNPIPEIFEISMNPENPYAEYLAGTVKWHIDGTIDQEMPTKATILSAKVVSDEGGETEFASTYAAYDDLYAEEKERYATLLIFHSFAAAMRPVYPNPTAEQRAQWKARGGREQPLVWTHKSGRRSLVLGETADYVVGTDPEDGRALLADLLELATAPDRVYRHKWSVGDMLIWDNTGVLHRVTPFDPSTRRELHRTTLLGDEPIR
jgi:alpha-ketoglutarate-dependent taurine dioxygenase